MSMQEFRDLIARRANAAPSEHRELDERLWQRWGRERTVMVTDMARFSRITRDHGIVHFLAMIHRMRSVCTEVIAAHQGHLVKAEADNLYVTFDEPQHALQAAIAMSDAVRFDGHGRPDAEQVWLGIGIAHGKILDIDGEDFYGDAVNLASKLGEDTATGGDILIAADAAQSVRTPSGFRFELRRTSVSSLEVEYRSLVRSHETGLAAAPKSSGATVEFTVQGKRTEPARQAAPEASVPRSPDPVARSDRPGDPAPVIVFFVKLAPGQSADGIFSDEILRDTQAQVMTTAEAKALGFQGFPDDADARLVAVAKRDAGWIEKALERAPQVGSYDMSEVDL